MSQHNLSIHKRMSVKDALKGLLSMNKGQRGSKSGTSTPMNEEEITISGPIGFQRHVHVGVGEDGEIVGIDNLLGYIAKTDKLEKASWDKLQSQQKELAELTEPTKDEEKTKKIENENETKEEKVDDKTTNFENQNSEVPRNEEDNELKRNVSSPQSSNSSTSTSFISKKEEENGEDKTKKYICKYNNEEERKEYNRPLIVGNPLKVFFTFQKAVEKGIILELNTTKSLDTLEVMLLYYLATKTFVVEVLSDKIPIYKDHVVLPLTQLVTWRKQGIKKLIIPDLNGDVYLVMNCPMSCLAFRDAFSSKNSKEISK